MHADGTLTILVVSADKAAQAVLVACFEADYRVQAAASGREALSMQEVEEVDLVLCDQRVGAMSGVEILREMRVSHLEAIRVLTTGPMAHDEMVRSFNDAAVYQIVPTPWNADHLRLLVKRALESRELARRHRYLSRELKFADSVLRRQNDRMARLLQDSCEFDKMVFASDGMAAVCNVARKAATNDLPVLIQGEAGTGKELMARAVHFFSTRKAFPLLAQNCGALPDELLQSELFGHKRGAYTGAVSDRLGLFPAADGGTVFLDEISDVSPTFQVSLSLSVPGWPSSAASWVATRATRAGRVPVTSIHPERNSPSPASAIMRRTSFSSSRTVQALETHLVTQSLLPHRWNHSRAARELGLSRVGLANKIKRYGLDRKDAV